MIVKFYGLQAAISWDAIAESAPPDVLGIGFTPVYPTKEAAERANEVLFDGRSGVFELTGIHAHDAEEFGKDATIDEIKDRLEEMGELDDY